MKRQTAVHRCGGRSSARSVSVADTPAGRERPDAADAADAAAAAADDVVGGSVVFSRPRHFSAARPPWQSERATDCNGLPLFFCLSPPYPAARNVRSTPSTKTAGVDWKFVGSCRIWMRRALFLASCGLYWTINFRFWWILFERSLVFKGVR